jgi:hypothetical protein
MRRTKRKSALPLSTNIVSLAEPARKVAKGRRQSTRLTVTLGQFHQTKVACPNRSRARFRCRLTVGERRLDVVEFIAICRAIPVNSVAILKKLAKLV